MDIKGKVVVGKDGRMGRAFLGRLGVADVVTVGNAALGLLAVVAVKTDPGLAARVVLLAAVADGLDGVLARRFGGTSVGPYLDSLADVASFAVAPAVLVAHFGTTAWPVGSRPLLFGFTLVVTALFVALAVVRLGVYTAEETHVKTTSGVQTTLAATIIAAAVLAGMGGAALFVGLTAVLGPLMVTPIRYPDLHAQDALVMGSVQGLAVVLPGRLGEVFAFALLFLALGYMMLGPWFYWRDIDAAGSGPG